MERYKHTQPGRSMHLSISLFSVPFASRAPCAFASRLASPLSMALVRSASSTPKKPERPISPHVTIYKFPTPAISSITNRVTGVAMSVGVVGMSLVALGGGCDIPAYVETVKTSAPILMPVWKEKTTNTV
jgi:hypothetical protein